MGEEFNWTKVEIEYVTGTEGYRGIAARYKVPRNRIADYGKKHDWQRKRREHQARTVALACQQTAIENADQIARTLGCLYDFAEKAARRLADLSLQEVKAADLASYVNAAKGIKDMLPVSNTDGSTEGSGIAFLPERTDGRH